MLLHLHGGDLRMALHAVSFAYFPNPHHPSPRPPLFSSSSPDLRSFRSRPLSLRASALPISAREKPPASCTADELHYVDVPGTQWRIALWRYTPCDKAPVRNHPLVLLSGVATNAVGFDLSPGASFARHMSSHGFDTWVVEVRGAGLSARIVSNSSNNSVLPDLVESKNQENQHNVPSRYQLSAENMNPKGLEVPFTKDQECQNSNISEQQKLTKNTNMQELEMSSTDGSSRQITSSDDQLQVVPKLTENLLGLTETLSGYLNEGQLKVVSDNFFERVAKIFEESGFSDRFNEIQGKLSAFLEETQNSIASTQIRDLSRRLLNLLDEGQRTVSPQFLDLQERLSKAVEEFQKQVDSIITYDWDFDNYLEEDIPAAMNYIKNHSQPKDGKLMAIGHSMGGIILYAMISKCGHGGKESGLAAVVTLASSLDYTKSNSSLKLLLPLADPAQALNVPAVPVGALMAAAYPLACRPPYVLSWINPQVSAEDMMHPELFEKLVLNNFCTVPAKVLLQLATAFREGGLRDRSGTFYYKDHLQGCKVPVLAVAGDKDLICPPEAVYETVRLLPRNLATYKLFGKPGGPHYGHYDIVGSRLATDEVYPIIIEFLCQNDTIC